MATEAPAWLSQLSVRLLISARVLISGSMSSSPRIGPHAGRDVYLKKHGNEVLRATWLCGRFVFSSVIFFWSLLHNRYTLLSFWVFYNQTKMLFIPASLRPPQIRKRQKTGCLSRRAFVSFLSPSWIINTGENCPVLTHARPHDSYAWSPESPNAPFDRQRD